MRMKLDPEDIDVLRKNGVKVTTKNEGLAKPTKPAKEEIDYLREIAASIATLAQKPVPTLAAPKVEVTAPAVNVQPPEVNVTVPKQEGRIKKWRFTINRDNDGKAKEIIASAME